MGLLLPLLLSLLAVLGAVIGVAAALRSGGPGDRARRARGSEQGLQRIVASVHTGWEQTLIGLIRELSLPRTIEGLRYGQLYLEMQSEQRILLRTRSEIGRGFLAAVDLVPERGRTRVVYAILRLPGDEDLNQQVLDLELRVIAALRRLDPNLDAQLSGEALRNYGRLREPADPELEPLPQRHDDRAVGGDIDVSER